MKSRHLQPLTQKLSSKYTIISPRLWQKSYLDNCSISFDIASHSPPASADMLLKWYQRPLMRREDVILAWLQAWQSHVSINGWFHHGFRWLKFLFRFSSHHTNGWIFCFPFGWSKNIGYVAIKCSLTVAMFPAYSHQICSVYKLLFLEEKVWELGTPPSPDT